VLRDINSARGLRHPGWVFALLLLLLVPGLGAAQEMPPQDPDRVKAAFIRHFAHYVTWPPEALPAEGASWCVGVLGADPFGEALESALKGRTEQGRPFRIVRADAVEQLPPCHIVFVAYKDAVKRRAALGGLRNKPVLSVGDAPEFLHEGGVVQFQVSDRVRMSINLDQARTVSLTIQTRMLEVCSDVLENGVIRHVR
jgi:hypothetical protein